MSGKKRSSFSIKVNKHCSLFCNELDSILSGTKMNIVIQNEKMSQN